MSGSFVLIAVVISVIAIAVVLAPLRGKQPQSSRAKNRPDPASQYEGTLLALRDLDFDHELGVIAEDDYQRLREELVAKAAQAMPRKKPGGKKRAARGKGTSIRGKKISTGAEQVAARADSSEDQCPDCGRPHERGHVFCGNCGTRLSAA